MNESIFVSAAVIGVVDFLKQLQARDYHGAMTILLAALVGGIAGFFGVDGLTITNGIVAGLVAVGVYRVSMAASGR